MGITTVADGLQERLEFNLQCFCLLEPSHANALNLGSGSWKYGFDTKELVAIQEWVRRDIRPQWCAEVFPGFSQFNIIELGPQDGFGTAGLEAFGVGQLPHFCDV